MTGGKRAHIFAKSTTSTRSAIQVEKIWRYFVPYNIDVRQYLTISHGNLLESYCNLECCIIYLPIEY